MTVIRKATIEVELKQKRSRLEAPGVADAGLKSQTEAATRAEQAVNKTTEATKRLAETSRSGAYTMATSFREGGEGAFRMARGIALLSANGSDDLKKLVQQVAIAQGAFDVFAGGFKAVTMLSRFVGGPWAAAIGVVTTALGVGAAAWSRYQAAAEQAAKAVEENRKKLQEFEQEHTRVWSRQNQRESGVRDRRDHIADLRLSTLSPELRAGRLEAEQSRLTQVGRDIDRDEARRLRGFSANRFKGGEAEAFDALLNFGSTSQLTNKRDLEQRRQNVAERQLSVNREQFNLQKEQLEEERKAAGRAAEQLASGARNFGFPGVGNFFDQTGSQLLNNISAKEADLVNRAQRGMNKIVDTIERAADKADRIERKLDAGAHTK